VTASEALKSTAAVSLILVDNSEYDQKVKLHYERIGQSKTGTTEFRADFSNPQGF
jgi:hypothetical protein